MKARGLSAEEKRVRGKVLRDAVSTVSCWYFLKFYIQSLSAGGPSRSRGPRVDTVVRDGLNRLATGFEKYLSVIY